MALKKDIKDVPTVSIILEDLVRQLIIACEKEGFTNPSVRINIKTEYNEIYSLKFKRVM